MKYLAILLLVVLASGCTSVGVTSGVSISVRADPSPVFSASQTNIFIDVDNGDDKTMENVVVRVFDSGLLQGDSCEQNYERILPHEFRSKVCPFYAPEIDEPAQTEINALTSFDADFSAVQLFDIMTQGEYQRRLDSGDYTPAPGKYSYNDRNVRVDVEFSEPPPVVLAPGKKYFVYFTVTNIGNGFIREINEENFRIAGHDTVFCPGFGMLEPNGKVFPRIACEIIVPDIVIGDKPFISSQIVLDFHYSYELRQNLKLGIVK